MNASRGMDLWCSNAHLSGGGMSMSMSMSSRCTLPNVSDILRDLFWPLIPDTLSDNPPASSLDASQGLLHIAPPRICTRICGCDGQCT
jgi:hypothetical protein